MLIVDVWKEGNHVSLDAHWDKYGGFIQGQTPWDNERDDNVILAKYWVCTFINKMKWLSTTALHELQKEVVWAGEVGKEITILSQEDKGPSNDTHTPRKVIDVKEKVCLVSLVPNNQGDIERLKIHHIIGSQYALR